MGALAQLALAVALQQEVPGLLAQGRDGIVVMVQDGLLQVVDGVAQAGFNGGLIRLHHLRPVGRKGSTFSSSDFKSRSISSRVVSRLKLTRKAPSMTSGGRFMAVST